MYCYDDDDCDEDYSEELMEEYWDNQQRKYKQMDRLDEKGYGV